MGEYITRNNAISAVCFGCNQQFSNEPCEPSECTIRQSIMVLPTADVVEVKHGEWIVKSEFVYTCSVCSYDSISESNYCRKCGAKMDGGGK